MNILITNKYKQYLVNYDYNVNKKIEGEYNAKDIVSMLANISYNKLIIDLTAIKDYRELSNLREIATNIETSKIILLLSNEIVTTSKYYISNIINMGIYNFTLIPSEIINLIQTPRSYEQAKAVKINE